MIVARSIQKFRDKNNNIIGYRLQDANGQIKDIDSANLKQAIRNKSIHVINLKLTTDGKLIDSKDKTVNIENKPKTVSNTENQTPNEKIQIPNEVTEVLKFINKNILDIKYKNGMLNSYTHLVNKLVNKKVEKQGNKVKATLVYNKIEYKRDKGNLVIHIMIDCDNDYNTDEPSCKMITSFIKDGTDKIDNSLTFKYNGDLCDFKHDDDYAFENYKVKIRNTFRPLGGIKSQRYYKFVDLTGLAK